MKYPDGDEVKVGDIVGYSDGSRGTVVCNIDKAKYTEEHSKDAWSYLEKGIMVESDCYGLIHYPDDLDVDMYLVKRKTG